jgi:hypothetical protein
MKIEILRRVCYLVKADTVTEVASKHELLATDL